MEQRGIIGIPKEIKMNEYRISLNPDDVAKLIKEGYIVYIEKGAGIGSDYMDEEYEKVGGRIVKDGETIYNLCNIIVKVKEPQEDEYGYINDRHMILAFFHFASNSKLEDVMKKSGAKYIAYETIVDEDGKYPILMPMSKIAGEQAMIYGNMYIKGDKTSEILVLGCGNVGMASVNKALEFGYNKINIMDNDVNKIESMRKYGYNTYEMTDENIWMLIRRCKIVIGSIYIKGEKASRIISNNMMEEMVDGSIIMDVAIDQGGITEQSRATTMGNPLIRYGRTSIYCVPNIPSCVPRVATNELSKAIYRYMNMNMNIS